MRLYIDSAELTKVIPLLESGVFYGVTTNPKVLQQALVGEADFPQLAHTLLKHGAREVYFQSWGEGLVLLERGRHLAKIDSRVVVKLPATQAGLQAAAQLTKEGVRTCITAVYSPYQALLANAVGAAYVAPYLGRMNDAGRDGVAAIDLMAQALRQASSPTQILAASIREMGDLESLAKVGVGCVTFGLAIAEQLFQEPLTLEATQAFEQAAKEVNP